MSQQAVTFDHAVGDNVAIAINGLSGTVIGQWNGRDGTRYDVEYADRNGCVSDRWFRPDEISAA